MGDLAMGEDRPFPLPSFAAPLCNPDPNLVRVEAWVVAEDTGREVLNRIHPTLDSEEKRKDVIEYVQRLIRRSLGIEVFPYGSVPLKTYLPDGDIDLTALSTPNVAEPLPRDVLAVLHKEEQNGNSEFELRDTQFIDAEVKLIKCLVQDIVIDISFNQLGGLCTLCFLEQVDRRVGKDHLFKRSIILIKAWCYYESRILGAHHGLISTYALETLVLYIFHVFNASLTGPVGVLYRFLDYYSKFDWDNYCVSLDGPVCKSSLPSIIVKDQENQGTDVLLSGEFLKKCSEMFIVPSKSNEINVRAFAPKHLNIIDPLKENNNLGRSVNRGNSYRIRSAFKFGARKLGRILELPSDKIGDEIKKFFTNTLQMHKPKFDPDAALKFGNKGFDFLSTSSLEEDDLYSKFSNGDLDDYTSLDDISTVGSTEANDLSSFRKPISSSRSSQHSHPHSVRDDNSAPSYIESNLEELCIKDNNNNYYDNVSDNLSLDFRDSEETGSIGEVETLTPLSDLRGDYDSHIRSLLYGRCCHGYASSAAPPVLTSPPTSPYQNNEPPWEAAVHSWSVPFQPPPPPPPSCSQVNGNGAFMGPGMFLAGPSCSPANGAFHWDERYNARGTGPFFPATGYQSYQNGYLPNGSRYRERPSTRGRGRNRGPPASNGQLVRARGGSGETSLVLEANHDGGSGSREPPPASNGQLVQARGGSGETSLVLEANHDGGSGPREPPSPKQDHGESSQVVNSTGSGFARSQRKLLFGSFGPMPENPSASGAQASQMQERGRGKAILLKNEDEFPPLSA